MIDRTTLWKAIEGQEEGDRRLEKRIEILEARIAALEAKDRPPVGNDPVARLREDCEHLGIVIAPDDMISEADAATLLGKSKSRLRAMRNAENPLRATKPLGRVRYSLESLAKRKYPPLSDETA